LGPSSFKGPQKHDLTMFPKCNYMNRYLRTRVKTIYDVKSMVETKADVAPKIRVRELQPNGGKRI
jgi:hypothetical protein